MFDSSLKKALVPSLLSTGAVFAALASPVFMFGNETLRIEQGQQSRWKGTVRDAAAPYLALAGVTSLGLGVSSVAITGWRKASQQAERIDDALRSQTEQMQQRELHVQTALTSQQYLAKTGLDFFLDDEPAIEVETAVAFEPEKLNHAKAAKATVAASQTSGASNATVIRSQPPLTNHKLATDKQKQHIDAFEQALAEFPRPGIAAETTESTPAAPAKIKQERRLSDRRTPSSNRTPSHPAPVIQSQPTASIQPIVITPIASVPSVQSTITPLTAAQGFIGFNRGVGQTAASESWNTNSTAQDNVTIEKIQSLQNQLQQIVSQIEALQVNLTPTQHSTATTAMDEAVLALEQQVIAKPATPEAQSPAWVVYRAAS